MIAQKVVSKAEGRVVALSSVRPSEEATLMARDALADEIAGAAELVMGKLDRCPVAVVRGLELPPSDETAQVYVRPKEKDLFR